MKTKKYNVSLNMKTIDLDLGSVLSTGTIVTTGIGTNADKLVKFHTNKCRNRASRKQQLFHLHDLPTLRI